MRTCLSQVLFYGSPNWARTSDIMHTALAVLGVKPREYEPIRTKAERSPHTLRAVALSQSCALPTELSRNMFGAPPGEQVKTTDCCFYEAKSTK